MHQKSEQRGQRREQRYRRVLRQLKEQAGEREAALRAELEHANAKIRDLQKRLFGRKSERHAGGERKLSGVSRVPRGQKRGAPGHGRRQESHLPVVTEVIEVDSQHCPTCSLPLIPFPGTEDSEVIEIEVRAYRRRICRKRYRRSCTCGPGIVTAPRPAQLIERGKYAVSVWTTVLLDKFLYGRPSHRLLQDLSDHGLKMSPGTLAGGLQALAPLFEPLRQALLNKLLSETHWHADETRWAVFIEYEGKVGYRWYLWVFHSPSAVYFELDPSRSADVVDKVLAGIEKGIISCDRYSAYKKFARLHPGIILAFCWAHQRRDFLELANAYPDSQAWAMSWVDEIAELYRLNGLRLKVGEESPERVSHQTALQQAVEELGRRRETELVAPELAEPARKVLQSMAAHWSGLTVFVEHPWIPMDNNVAERDHRGPVVGRKNYYGSGSAWSGQLAATMFSLFMTIKLWGFNARTWLGAYLQACADNGGDSPSRLEDYLPWAMDTTRLAAMRAASAAIDSS